LNARLSFLLAAVEALVVAAIGVGITLAPMTLIWLIENDPSIDWFVAFRTSADIWLMSHGTRLVVPAGSIVGIETPQFILSIIPLGFSIIIGAMAFRLGRRMASGPKLRPAWVGASLAYGVAAFGISTAAYTEAIYPVAWQGTFFPPAVFIFFMLLGSLTSPTSEAIDVLQFQRWFHAKVGNLNWAIRAIAAPALRGGTAIVAMLMAASAVIFALLLAANWINLIRLYEGLQVSAFGGLLLTVGELVLLPNLIFYGASWLTGAGFAIGAGSSISPLGTAAGPIPSIPVLAALPVGELSFGMIAILVPLLATFFAMLAIKKHSDEIRFEFASPLSAAVSLGLAVAAVAAIEMGVLAQLASGAVGPGRLEQVGVMPWLIILVTFVEVAAVAIPVAFYSARPQRADHPLLDKAYRPSKAARKVN
jgi:hypothetical protein